MIGTRINSYIYDKTNDSLVHAIFDGWESKFTLGKSIEMLWDYFKLMYEIIISVFNVREVIRGRAPLFKQPHA